MHLHSLGSKTAIVLIWVGTASVSALVLAFLIWPAFVGVTDASGQIVDARSREVSVGVENSQLNDFMHQYPLYHAQLDAVDAAFVDPQNPLAFIESLEQDATASGVSVDISLANPVLGNLNAPPPDKSSVYFQVRTVGSFSATRHFLQMMELGPYPVDCQKMSIHLSNQNGNSSGNATATYAPGDLIAVFSIRTLAAGSPTP